MPRNNRPDHCERCDDSVEEYNLELTRYNGDWLCENCYERVREEEEEYSYEDEYHGDDSRYQGILSYGSKPRPEFHHRKNDGTTEITPRPKTFLHKNKISNKEINVNLPYLSCELEAEAPYVTDLNDAAIEVNNNTNHLVYCKSDCSINNGFEMVSQPMTLDYFQNACGHFERQITIMRRRGWRAWDASNCGFHIHLEKKSFVDPAHQMKFIYFILNNKNKMIKFTGRNSSYARYDLDTFLNIDNNLWRNQKPTILGMIKNNLPKYERNLAVNLMPENTCELRMFKPSMRFETLVAYFEFVHCLWAFTKDVSTQDVLNKKALKNFNVFFDYANSNQNQYSAFVKRAIERRIIGNNDDVNTAIPLTKDEQ